MVDETEAERKAMEWLDGEIEKGSWSLGVRERNELVARHARTVKDMLARPVLPEDLTDDDLMVMKRAVHDAADIPDFGPVTASQARLYRAGHRALYARLTRPKKLKPVFRLEGGYNPRHPTIPSATLEADWHDVNQAIGALCNDGYETVTVRREMVPE